MTINEMISELILRRGRGDITGEEVVMIIDPYGDSQEPDELMIENNEAWLVWSKFEK
jgi:hypothetical protein